MNWKLLSFVLSGLLLMTMAISFVITSNALRASSAANRIDQERQLNWIVPMPRSVISKVFCSYSD